ncbi:TPA: transcriptional regulator [Salmonella enterica subsp. enterica serovar Oranienburg]
MDVDTQDSLAEMERLIASKIIISDTVVFIPASRELRNDVTGELVTLYTPASYCLLHLLASRPQILTKAELIKLSWNDKSQIISDNTFNQMVFHLRQSLAKVGADGIIITVPRRGLKINPCVSVKISGTGIQESTQTTSNIINFITGITGGISLSRRRNIFMVILSGFLLFLSGFLYTSEPDKTAFNDYLLQEYKMCTVSYNGKIRKENISAFLTKSKTDCSRKRYIILTQSDNHSRLSVISCPVATGNTKSCALSLYVQ